MDEQDFEEIDDLLYEALGLFWTKNMIAECYKKGMDKKETIQYMYDLAEFTTEIISELHERDGIKVEVIGKWIRYIYLSYLVQY